jgi:hypothetical protein
MAIERLQRRRSADEMSARAVGGVRRLAIVASALVALALSAVVDAGVEGQAVRDTAPHLEVFVSWGCPHCEAAKPFVERLRLERPDLRIVLTDVADDPTARDRLMALARERGITAVGVPAFHVGDSLLIGFDASGVTEATVRRLLPPPSPPEDSIPARAPPPAGPGVPSPGVEFPPATPAPAPGEVTLPIFGEVNATRLGLPLFSFAVGFVDGLNPCAMWALLYLLTLLAPLRNRRRMFLLGSAFIVTGGVLYFVFLAAWLEVFLLIGFSRLVQVTLGSVALLAATVHVKDFVAFGKGPSLSIPDSARPGIYRRARRVITAENVAGALAAVVALSLLVNMVELLCTAGLPAVYTQILTANDLSRVAYYANLGIYVGAYILDDLIVLAVGVITLSQRRLQERAGRWLKLLSGVVLGALGAVLLFRPQWLG